MKFDPISITSYTATTAVGHGRMALLDALQTRRSGLSDLKSAMISPAKIRRHSTPGSEKSKACSRFICPSSSGAMSAATIGSHGLRCIRTASLSRPALWCSATTERALQ